MKIASILAHYLYTNKKLGLPGIGIFFLDDNTVIETETTKNKPVILNGVSFVYDSSVKEDPDLIAFISSHTGKIKPLASSDLESFLELAKQFMNIGKPFLFEGIGTISKINRNEYVFAAGVAITEPLKEHVSHDALHNTAADYQASYKEVLFHKKEAPKWKRPLFILLSIAGIVLAIWGGYTVYKNSAADNERGVAQKELTPLPVKNNTTEAVQPADTIHNAVPANDTALQTVTAPVTPVPMGSYKFIVETAEKERALARFEKLKNSFKLPVQLETKDSLTFKIYFILAAHPADTARLIDSLKKAYTPPGKRAYVE